MKILLIGDVVGRPGRAIVTQWVPRLRQELGLEFVIANGENAAGGVGLTPAVAQELFEAGIDVLTGGNHTWKKKEIYGMLNGDPRVLRPANYPNGAPGRGLTVLSTGSGQPIAVLSLLGRVFLANVDCPFRAADRLLEEIQQSARMIVVDIHAEATSEKLALSRYLDGRVSAVFGTHTHVPTADAEVFPGGTAHITDVGMTGPYESVIGRKIEPIIERFMSQLPMKSDVATEDPRLMGAVVEVDEQTGRAISIERLERRLDS